MSSHIQLLPAPAPVTEEFQEELLAGSVSTWKHQPVCLNFGNFSSGSITDDGSPVGLWIFLWRSGLWSIGFTLVDNNAVIFVDLYAVVFLVMKEPPNSGWGTLPLVKGLSWQRLWQTCLLKPLYDTIWRHGKTLLLYFEHMSRYMQGNSEDIIALGRHVAICLKTLSTKSRCWGRK